MPVLLLVVGKERVKETHLLLCQLFGSLNLLNLQKITVGVAWTAMVVVLLQRWHRRLVKTMGKRATVTSMLSWHFWLFYFICQHLSSSQLLSSRAAVVIFVLLVKRLTRDKHLALQLGHHLAVCVSLCQSACVQVQPLHSPPASCPATFGKTASDGPWPDTLHWPDPSVAVRCFSNKMKIKEMNIL